MPREAPRPVRDPGMIAPRRVLDGKILFGKDGHETECPPETLRLHRTRRLEDIERYEARIVELQAIVESLRTAVDEDDAILVGFPEELPEE